MMTKGTLASVTTGAIAAAFGVHTTPVMSCTFSRTTQLGREALWRSPG